SASPYRPHQPASQTMADKKKEWLAKKQAQAQLKSTVKPPTFPTSSGPLLPASGSSTPMFGMGWPKTPALGGSGMTAGVAARYSNPMADLGMEDMIATPTSNSIAAAAWTPA